MNEGDGLVVGVALEVGDGVNWGSKGWVEDGGALDGEERNKLVVGRVWVELEPAVWRVN